MTIDAAPVIETERLRLERWDDRHTPLLVRLASMPEVMRLIGTGEPWPPLLAEDVARAERRHWEDHGFGWRATIDKAIDWSRTGRDGRTYDLLIEMEQREADENGLLCDSEYGLCE